MRRAVLRGRYGRSPLTRGSLGGIHDSAMRDGSIPAHAGEPSWPGSWATRAAVDPRSRGGARSFPHRPFQCLGRSPLTRGSRIKHPQRSVRHGSIPAHAGEPPASVSSISLIQVDPRSRGGALATPTHGTVAGGRSPLTRGSLGGNAGTGTRERSIPAHAGEPGLIDYLRRDLGVDPRSRGGAPSGSLTTPTCRGRSPLTRGSRGRRLETGGRERSIPAHAGEPYHAKSISKPAMVDPRSRGGAHQFFHLGSLGQGRSPLTRGSLPLLLPQRGPRRSIPAHAGEPRSERPWAREMGVDPRSRGGATVVTAVFVVAVGRSPLTRGSLLTAYHPGTYDTTFVVLFTCQGSPGELSVATAVRLVSTIPSRSTSSTGGIPKTLTDWPAGRSMESQTITILAFSSS